MPPTGDFRDPNWESSDEQHAPSRRNASYAQVVG
jgi:hypothetical protein